MYFDKLRDKFRRVADEQSSIKLAPIQLMFPKKITELLIRCTFLFFKLFLTHPSQKQIQNV